MKVLFFLFFLLLNSTYFEYVRAAETENRTKKIHPTLHITALYGSVVGTAMGKQNPKGLTDRVESRNDISLSPHTKQPMLYNLDAFLESGEEGLGVFVASYDEKRTLISGQKSIELNKPSDACKPYTRASFPKYPTPFSLIWTRSGDQLTLTLGINPERSGCGYALPRENIPSKISATTTVTALESGMPVTLRFVGSQSDTYASFVISDERMVDITLVMHTEGLVNGCVNTATPTCGVYRSCFAERCKCDNSEYEYFKSYGEKYCNVFLNLPGLSPQGKAWRDSTLKCLQETIVPLLPTDGQEESCNCKSMQIKVFDTHVACYTQANNSICDLSVTDWLQILDAVDPVANLTDQRSRKQMLEIAKICLPIAADNAKSTIHDLMKKLMN